METAIEKIEKHLNYLYRLGYSDVSIVNLNEFMRNQKLKELEKQQILDAYKNGCDLGWEETRANEYFKNTYENKK